MGVMGLVLTACPPPCEYSLIDHGTLSEEAISCSPYIDGQSYNFIHSEGHEISFLTRRVRELQNQYWDECMEVKSESDVSTLTPDYPLFSFDVAIHKSDTARYECLISVGGSRFWYPPTIQMDFGHTYHDSIQIGNTWHREVYKLGNTRNDRISDGQIIADSIYYNTKSGILKILMSNEEYYDISN